MRVHVEKGQLWSVIDVMRPRYELRVTHVTDNRTFGTCPGGKEVSVATSVLETGRRGARLIENADGTTPKLTKRQQQNRGQTPVFPSSEETKTASDYLKTQRPRGVVKTSDLQREALALREAGATLKDLAEKYGKATGIISAWLSRAREAREDERNLAECRRAS